MWSKDSVLRFNTTQVQHGTNVPPRLVRRGATTPLMATLEHQWDFNVGVVKVKAIPGFDTHKSMTIFLTPHAQVSLGCMKREATARNLAAVFNCNVGERG